MPPGAEQAAGRRRGAGRPTAGAGATRFTRFAVTPAAVRGVRYTPGVRYTGPLPTSPPPGNMADSPPISRTFEIEAEESAARSARRGSTHLFVILECARPAAGGA